MNRTFYVYVVFRPCGVPCYVGKGTGGRWKTHIKRSHNQRLQRIFAKAGGDLPIAKIREGLTETEAFEVERALITSIGRDDLGAGPLVNLTDGGEGFTGGRHSAEIRERIGARTRGKRQRPEHTAKIRAALTGVKPKPLDEQGREKWLAALRESPKVAAHIADLASKSRGRPLSAEHREKVRLANLGAKRSPEARARMSAAQRRRFQNSFEAMKPWLALGISKRTWLRRRKQEREQAVLDAAKRGVAA